MLLYFRAWVSVRLSVLLAFYDALCSRVYAAHVLMCFCFGPQSLWVERTTMTLVQSLPGISRWFEVDKRDLVRGLVLNTTAPFLNSVSELPPLQWPICNGFVLWCRWRWARWRMPSRWLKTRTCSCAHSSRSARPARCRTSTHSPCA